MIHHLVETLDKYFTNVCELDLIFNFHKAYYIVDELLLGGARTLSAPFARFILVCTQLDFLVDSAHYFYIKCRGGSTCSD